jgi:acetyltransferase-like isoleucine patch superfamily enzyme
MIVFKWSLMLLFKSIHFSQRIYNLAARKYDFYNIMATAAEVGGVVRVKGEKSFVNKGTYLGKNINLNGLRVYGNGTVRIGDNFHCGMGCIFITQNHNFQSDSLPYGKDYQLKNIVIENNVWLGQQVIILGGVTIGEGSIIQAGSVVVSDIPPLSIAGGHPAKKFKNRDSQHYYNLKDSGKFH